MKTPFDGLSDTEVLPKTGAILTTLANDPELLLLVLSLLPSQSSLQEAHDRHHESFNASLSGTGGKPEQLAEDRRLLNRRFSTFITMVQLAALEDPTLTARAGIVTPEKVPVSSPALTAPANFRIWHGDIHGVINAKCSSVKGAKSFLVEICVGDPTIEANWRFGAVSSTCTLIVVEGLVPGTVYSFRVRAIRATGHGPWSSYITLMAI
jgi:hypothetical protein